MFKNKRLDVLNGFFIFAILFGTGYIVYSITGNQRVHDQSAQLVEIPTTVKVNFALSTILLVNNTHTPAPVQYGDVATVSWNDIGAKSTTVCTPWGAHVLKVGGGLWTQSGNLPASGSMQLYTRSQLGYLPSLQIGITCTDAGVITTDSVFLPVNPETPAQMVVMGGKGISEKLFNDVYGSSDGITWKQLVANGGTEGVWSGRILQGLGSSAYFQKKIWVVGGANNAGFVNDVWSSVNGKEWNLETNNPGWSPRSTNPLVFNNKLWVIGGRQQGGLGTDIWSSPNGKTWTYVFTLNVTRVMTNPVVFQNKIWIVGGQDEKGLGHNDIFTSTDGTTWQQNTTPPPWPARFGHTTIVFKNKLYVFGGKNLTPVSNGTFKENFYNDVWSTTDGVTWTQITANAGWSPRFSSASVVFDGKLWVFGGSDTALGYRSDAWYTTNGKTWIKSTDHALWPPRDLLAASTLPAVTINNGGCGSMYVTQALQITTTSAVLNGCFTANGVATTTWFEYGTTQSFGNATDHVSQGFNNGPTSALISNLKPNTKYYYRLVKQNSVTNTAPSLGVSTFTTLPLPNVTAGQGQLPSGNILR